MNNGLKILTLVFTLMCIENVFRVADYIGAWSYPFVEETRPNDLDFSSEYEVPDSPTKNDKLMMRKELGPGALGQTIVCMILMLVNNLIWVRRKSFSPVWHTLHYFIAVAILILYLPRKDWWPVMTGVKYMYTVMNIFIFQMLLGTVGSLTATHQLIAMLVTMVDLVLSTKYWFSVSLKPLCVWDGYLHMILPVIIMVGLGYINMKDQLKKDKMLINEYDDMKKILGSLTQGVALTVNFH